MSAIEFSAGLIVVLLLWLAWSLRGVNLGEYFKTRTGRGVAKGILMALGIVIGFTVVFGLAGCSGTYLNDASVYAGLDYTKKLSPQCEPTGPDSNTTSNLGFKLNLYQSDDKRFRTNAKYTHHSCAFSKDDAQYDALGIELEYKLWVK